MDGKVRLDQSDQYDKQECNLVMDQAVQPMQGRSWTKGDIGHCASLYGRTIGPHNGGRGYRRGGVGA